jgi:hypothetical protein
VHGQSRGAGVTEIKKKKVLGQCRGARVKKYFKYFFQFIVFAKINNLPP